MPLYIIQWDAGYGDEYEEIKAEREEAIKYTYAQWRAETDLVANYSVVGLSTDKLKEEFEI